jgi:hypothetical protein
MRRREFLAVKRRLVEAVRSADDPRAAMDAANARICRIASRRQACEAAEAVWDTYLDCTAPPWLKP